MKRKSLKSEVVDIAEKGIVTIAISRFDNEDMGGDIVRKGAFVRTFKEGGDRIKHYMDHQLKQMANVGLPVKMYETSTHAVVESALNLEKEISRDLFSDYKFFKEHGKTLEHSYGYETIKGKARGRGEEIFLVIKLLSYSIFKDSFHALAASAFCLASSCSAGVLSKFPTILALFSSALKNLLYLFKSF